MAESRITPVWTHRISAGLSILIVAAAAYSVYSLLVLGQHNPAMPWAILVLVVANLTWLAYRAATQGKRDDRLVLDLKPAEISEARTKLGDKASPGLSAAMDAAMKMVPEGNLTTVPLRLTQRQCDELAALIILANRTEKKDSDG